MIYNLIELDEIKGVPTEVLLALRRALARNELREIKAIEDLNTRIHQLAGEHNSRFRDLWTKDQFQRYQRLRQQHLRISEEGQEAAIKESLDFCRQEAIEVSVIRELHEDYCNDIKLAYDEFLEVAMPIKENDQ